MSRLQEAVNVHKAIKNLIANLCRTGCDDDTFNQLMIAQKIAHTHIINELNHATTEEIREAQL